MIFNLLSPEKKCVRRKNEKYKWEKSQHNVNGVNADAHNVGPGRPLADR